MKNNQLGRFMIDGMTLITNLDSLVVMMSGLVVVAARHALTKDATEYVAIGPDFDEIERGSLIPEYQAIMHQDEDGVITRLHWERV